MKRSRLALGITAFVLGIAAAISARSKGEVSRLYYTTGGVENACVPISIVGPIPCPTGGTGCYITMNGDLYQLYLGQEAGMCTIPLAEGD